MRLTGGTCEGGDHIKAYEFIYQYGISDDNCMPYAGLNWRHGFHVAGLSEVEDVRDHQCHTCSWDGNCGFIPRYVNSHRTTSRVCSTPDTDEDEVV